jgi:hypothetical protein
MEGRQAHLLLVAVEPHFIPECSCYWQRLGYDRRGRENYLSVAGTTIALARKRTGQIVKCKINTSPSFLVNVLEINSNMNYELKYP